MVLFLKMLGELANSHPPQKPEYIQSNLKTNINEIKKISKNFFELNTQYQTAKEKYLNDCQIAEDTITEFEQTKESLEPSEQSVQEENMEKKLQIAKDSETNYIKLMESVNSEKDKFYEQGSSLFKKLKNYDSEINSLFHNVMHNLYLFLIKKNEEEIKLLKKETEGINKILASTNSNQDLYVINPIKQETFIPYELEVLKPNEAYKGIREMEERIQLNVYKYNITSKMKSKLTGIAKKVRYFNYLY